MQLTVLKQAMSTKQLAAINVQPYSVVNDAGFKDVIRVLEPRYVLTSRKYFLTKMTVERCTSQPACVQSEVDHAKSVCRPADTWMVQNTTQSFCGLTARRVTDDFGQFHHYACDI